MLCVTGETRLSITSVYLEVKCEIKPMAKIRYGHKKVKKLISPGFFPLPYDVNMLNFMNAVILNYRGWEVFGAFFLFVMNRSKNYKTNKE